MNDISYNDLVSRGAFKILGRLFPDALSSRDLLEEIGADPATLIPFAPPATAEQFWRDAGRQIRDGAFETSLSGLLDQALRRYPHNRELRDLRPRLIPDPVAERRVLQLLAGPTDQARLMLGQEHEIIREVVRGAAPPVALTVNTAIRRSLLLASILEAEPEVIHFSGHGSEQGTLVLETESGMSAPVSLPALADMLDERESLACLVLAACHAGGRMPPNPGRRYSVIACRHQLGDRAALAFSRGFYTGFALRKPIADCYALGLHQMKFEGFAADGMELIPAIAAGDGTADGP